MEPAIIVAVVSIATATVSAAGGVLVAYVTNRREAENAADDAMESTLRERIVLRDEQLARKDRVIAALREDLEAEKAKKRGPV